MSIPEWMGDAVAHARGEYAEECRRCEDCLSFVFDPKVNPDPNGGCCTHVDSPWYDEYEGSPVGKDWWCINHGEEA